MIKGKKEEVEIIPTPTTEDKIEDQKIILAEEETAKK